MKLLELVLNLSLMDLTVVATIALHNRTRFTGLEVWPHYVIWLVFSNLFEWVFDLGIWINFVGVGVATSLLTSTILRIQGLRAFQGLVGQ